MIIKVIIFVLFLFFSNSFSKWGWFEKWSTKKAKMITFMIISDLAKKKTIECLRIYFECRRRHISVDFLHNVPWKLFVHGILGNEK
jgi:hypothetical protein